MEDPERDELLETLVARYLVERDKGAGDPLAEICSEHPDLADEIRERADDLERLQKQLSQLRDPDAAAKDGAIRKWGRFSLLRELGRGGMGVVHLAWDEQLHRHVALKAMGSPALMDPRRFARFEREVRAIAQLKHPGIVPLYDSGTHEGVPYFTMEYVEGCTLADYVHWFHEEGVRPADLTARYWMEACQSFQDVDAKRIPALDPQRETAERPRASRAEASWGRSYVESVCRLIIDVAEALEHAHENGVVHRDVKPSNILVRSDGRALLFDFGLAHVDEHAALTMSGELLGTPYYISPEQVAEGQRSTDQRTDIYSLGVTLYELLTLRVPFRGATTQQIFRGITSREPDPVRRHNPAVPRDLENICLIAMEKDARRRYASAADLVTDLRRFLEFRPVHARPVGAVTRAMRLIRRNPATSVAVALAFLLVIGGPIVFGIYNKIARDALAIEKAEAVEQRNRALRNLRLAQSAVKRLVDEVADGRLAHIPLFQSTRREILEDTLVFYEALGEAEGEDAGVRLGKAEALAMAGEIRAHLGFPKEALDAYDRAEEILEGLVDTDVDHTIRRFMLVSIRIERARGLTNLNRYGEAEEIYRAALSTAQDLMDKHPEDADLLVPLAIGWRNLARILAGDGRAVEAEQALEEAMSHQEALLAAFPDENRYTYVQAIVLMQRGLFRENAGRIQESEADLRRAHGILESLERQYPDPVYRHELADCSLRLGNIVGIQRDLDGAEQFFSGARRLLEDLCRSFPDVPSYRSDLADSCRALGKVWQERESPNSIS